MGSRTRIGFEEALAVGESLLAMAKKGLKPVGEDE